MKRLIAFAFICLACFCLFAGAGVAARQTQTDSRGGAQTVALSSVLDVRQSEYEFARATLDKCPNERPLAIAGQAYKGGVCAQAETVFALAPNGATRFRGLAGVDDSTEVAATVVFEVRADGRPLWRAQLRKGEKPAAFDLEVRGVKELLLAVEDTGNATSRAYADWLDASFTVEGEKPKTIQVPLFKEEAVRLTPPAPYGARINGPRVFGVRPGSPFLFNVSATGGRPLRFAADNLPEGLKIDSETGRITGVVTKPGSYEVTLRASNERSAVASRFRIEVGERIALTPPMGWNSWNAWGEEVTQEKVLRSARAMASSELINYGWTYVNTDDAWQAPRGGRLNALQGNEKFPDIKALCDEIHALGLKAGIYSTPWVQSYAGYPGGSLETLDAPWKKTEGPKQLNRKVLPWAIGRHHFADNDAKQWAEWGVDYLKYDWSPNEVPETEEMARALRASGRDIVYSLSNNAPFANAADWARLANAWRTTGDIRDTWTSVSHIGFSQDRWRPFAGPGHWNDPDMLVVGHVGWGRPHPTRLTPNEQYTHISLWCLLSAPLLLGNDLEKLDDFTLGLLTNDEVLDVDQDPLGRQAAQVLVDGRRQVWVKEMEDGSHVVGLFNLARWEQPLTIEWRKLGLRGAQRVRDLWRQKYLGVAASRFTARVPRHGVVLIKVWPVRR
ncbi:MAG TPA: NPCBM/NEW2 domain-containing protein [Pyrinomonadaceae bacterium]|nr:NPCBM/NEW2 domain-containing protein [Pyrinomonadaceae bacterium]